MKMYFVIPLFLLFVVAMGCLGQPQTQTTQPGTSDVPSEKPTTEVVKEKPKIVLDDYPTQINAGENANFKWSVSGAKGTVTHSAIHVGKESNVVSDSVSPDKTTYTLSTVNYESGSFAVPGQFTDSIKVDEPGTYYARAHTVVDGKNVWSEEISFTVMGAQGQAVKEYTIKVSDSGFEPSEVKANKGDLVKLHFEVTEGTNAAGVRILSQGWNGSPALKPGELQDVEFTADSSFEYNLYWLAGNLLRGKGKVTVE
jgi:plastocyanin